VAAGRVLVAKDVPPGFVEVPQQGRGDALDERGNRCLAGLGEDPTVARRQAPGEHPSALGGVDDRSQRRVLPRARDADGRDGAGAGLDRLGDLLCVDWVSPHGPWDDLLNFIFDGGTLNDSGIASLRLVDSELRAFEFCDEGQAKERLRPYVWRRASAALEALGTGRARYLQDGYA
jgi:hypothetical protein